jgi:hypothetical protein
MTGAAIERADVLETEAWIAAAKGDRREARNLVARAADYRRELGLRPREPTRRLTEALAGELLSADVTDDTA